MPPSSGLTAAPSSSGSAPQLKAAQLAAGLLPASAFGTDLKAGAPKQVDKPLGAVADVGTASCYDLEATGESLGSVSHATQTMTPGTPTYFVTEQIYQFPAGDAKLNLSALARRLSGECAAFHDASANVDVTVKTTPTSGLGDQALLVETVEKAGGTGDMHSAMMVARYGDVVVAVTAMAPDTGKVAQYDVTGKAKAIAAKLRLG